MSNTRLYNTGRAPLWLRIPLLMFGLLILWLGIAIAAKGLFGVTWISGQGSTLFGSLACFAIAALFIFVWFAQLEIVFDDVRQELVVRTRGYFRFHEHRISLAGGREIHMRHVHSGFNSWKWEVTVEYADGRSEHVASITSEIEPLAKSLEAVTKLPVRQLGEPSLEQKSNREIISSIVVLTLICGFLIVVNIRLLVIGGNLFSIIWGASGVIFLIAMLLVFIPPGIRELRRRRRKTRIQ